MGSSLVAVLGLITVLAGCGLGDGNDGRSGPAPSSRAAGQLFVASAAEGRLQSRGEHQFSLVLGEANDSVAVFTDRPERRAGTESIARFVARWEGRGFAESPPNAAVVWGKGSSTRVFEIENPSYDAATDTVSFDARDLGDEPATALSSFAGTPDAELPTELGEVSVFIDDASVEGSGGFFFVVGPAGGEATITFKDQTLFSDSYHVVRGKGWGRQASPSQIDVGCEDEKCYIAVSFTLNPGTWPVEGTLEASSGVTVGRSMQGGTTVKIPAGEFTYGEDGK